MDKINLIKIILLILIITGAFTFLFAISYWEEPLVLLSLIQLMSGSVGIYMIQTDQKTPL